MVIWRLFRNISFGKNGLAKTISHFGCHNEISLTWNLTRHFPFRWRIDVISATPRSTNEPLSDYTLERVLITSLHGFSDDLLAYSISIITLRAICGAVYCNCPCLFVGVCVWVGRTATTITRNCVHRSSPKWVCR